jgi:hypothetical protein
MPQQQTINAMNTLNMLQDQVAAATKTTLLLQQQRQQQQQLLQQQMQQRQEEQLLQQLAMQNSLNQTNSQFIPMNTQQSSI